MTPEDLQAQIEKAAQTAVGYDTNRGDAITVFFCAQNLKRQET